MGIDVLGSTFELASAGLRVVSEGAGSAFELDTTIPVGARPVKVGCAGAMTTGLGPPGLGIGMLGLAGIGIGVVGVRVSTHVPFIQLKPVGHGG